MLCYFRVVPGRTMDAKERHDRGRAHLAAVLNHWLHRSGLSHSQAVAISVWEAGERCIQASQLSKLRNEALKTPFLKQFEGLAALNAGIARWHQQGGTAARAARGMLPPEVTAAVMDQAIWLHCPDNPERPLVFRDFCDLFVGNLRLPYVEKGIVTDPAARMVSDAIGRRLERYLLAQGGVRDGFRRLITHYPTTNQDRINRLRDVVLGQGFWTAEQLQEELLALATLLSAIEGQPVSPTDLLGTGSTGTPNGPLAGETLHTTGRRQR